MTLYDALIATIVHNYTSYLILLGILTVLEILVSRQRQTLRCRLNGVVIWAAYIPISVCIYKGLYALWDWLGITALLNFSLIRSLGWAGPVAIILAACCSALVADFFLYWYHRAQHRLLWRFHAVHHSIRDLNAINSYHHVSEALFSGVLIALPTTLIVVDYGPTVPVLVFLTSLQAVYLHSPTRLNAGPLRAMLGDNVWHRVHHSLDKAHFDKNFGVLTTFWDRVFGTAYFPRSDEWPAVGLVDQAPPGGLREWVMFPARYSRKSL